jgi:hypothetical protein
MLPFSRDFWGKDQGCEEKSGKQIPQEEGSVKGRFYH